MRWMMWWYRTKSTDWRQDKQKCISDTLFFFNSCYCGNVAAHSLLFSDSTLYFTSYTTLQSEANDILLFSLLLLHLSCQRGNRYTTHTLYAYIRLTTNINNAKANISELHCFCFCVASIIAIYQHISTSAGKSALGAQLDASVGPVLPPFGNK